MAMNIDSGIGIEDFPTTRIGLIREKDFDAATEGNLLAAVRTSKAKIIGEMTKPVLVELPFSPCVPETTRPGLRPWLDQGYYRDGTIPMTPSSIDSLVDYSADVAAVA